jgi:heat shock protein HslJ
MRPLSRPALIVACMVLLVASCEALRGSPAHTLELEGTSWTVTGVGGSRPPEGVLATLAFTATEDLTIETGCRQVTGRYTLDTDGSAISFFDLKPMGPSCSGGAGEFEAKLLDAVRGASSWVVTDSRHIKLQGRTDVDLNRRT